MRKIFFTLWGLVQIFLVQAQNVGINITTPQATLDVRGSQRTGGISNYIKYDSATGRIEWVGASLFTPISQQIIKHSASSEGMYAGGGKLEYRNSIGNPVFYSDWTNGNGYFSGKLGINTINPSARLHIYDGASGIAAFFSARMVVESNSHSYINLLSPDPFETGILFGSGTNAASGVISYNSTATPKGFLFSDNGNQQRMVIDNAGRVGIGTTTPNAPLGFPPLLGKKITLYPGATGDVGMAVLGNLFQIYSDNPNADIAFGYDQSGTMTERMRIQANGNVGIGTASPAAKLQISGGDASLVQFGPNSYGVNLFVGASNANQSDVSKAQVIATDGNLHLDPAAGKNIYVGYFQPRDIFLNPNGGYVGIGTTPSYTLDVTSSSQRTANFVNTTTLNNAAVVASCNNIPGKGRGVEGYGGEAGVSGHSIINGAGGRIGVIGYGWNGATDNYGVYGSASGGTVAYGIYGDAANAVNNWSGYFNGNVYAVGSYYFSDRKLKNDIRPLSGALSIINQLNPSVYTCKTNEYKQMNLPEGLQYGLIADEVQQVLPGAVKKAIQPAEYENNDVHNGRKLSDEVEFNAVNYTAIIPILIAAVKEQQVMIEELKVKNQKMDLLQQQVNDLMKEIQLIKDKMK